MREVVVVDAVRTPLGKGHPEKGIFKDVRADDLGVVCVRALLARRRFPPAMMFMGQTAEILAERKGISRKDSDRFALRSNQRAVAAHEEGRFKDELVPVALPAGGTADRDQGPRGDTTLEKLATLVPSFKEGGQVTAGNSSQISDGAAAVLLMTRERAKELGLPGLATMCIGFGQGIATVFERE